MSKFKINDVELDIDMLDADELENIDAALHKAEADAELDSSKSPADSIRQQVGAVRDCFDKIFGAGTGDKIIGKKANLRVAFSAFADFCEEVARQKSEFGKTVSLMKTKYSPNRAERRAADKSK